MSSSMAMLYIRRLIWGTESNVTFIYLVLNCGLVLSFYINLISAIILVIKCIDHEIDINISININVMLQCLSC